MRRFLLVLLSAWSMNASATTELVIVVEPVKILNGHTAEALFYYEKNWLELRRTALAQGFIHSYELVYANAKDFGDFDLLLVTRYTGRDQQAAAEENFRGLIEQLDGVQTLNDTPRAEFRQVLATRIGISRQ